MIEVMFIYTHAVVNVITFCVVLTLGVVKATSLCLHFRLRFDYKLNVITFEREIEAVNSLRAA